MYILAPGTPSNSSGVAINSTHIFLTWDPPPLNQTHGDIQGYLITLLEYETGDVLQYNSNTTDLLVGPLHPYYIYNCSISAVTVEPGPPIIIVVRTHEAGMLQSYSRAYMNNIFLIIQHRQVHHRHLKQLC